MHAELSSEYIFIIKNTFIFEYVSFYSIFIRECYLIFLACLLEKKAVIAPLLH